jgi:hypothetical protein
MSYRGVVKERLQDRFEPVHAATHASGVGIS